MAKATLTTKASNRPSRRVRDWVRGWFPGSPGIAGQPDRQTRSMLRVADELAAADRYAFVLLDAARESVSDAATARSWKALRSRMALIPTGEVPVVRADGAIAAMRVDAYFLDIESVTNEQYLKFVAAGGYENLEHWPEEIWSSVLRFVDRTKQPGPRDWSHGKPPEGKGNHPVVGVCWHEAAAYARWVGKRLPTAAEWQKAAGWPEELTGGMGSRYPWGDVFAPDRVNLWCGGRGGTVPAADYPQGATPNGIKQMAGNVWEWLEDPLETIPCGPEERFVGWQPMRRIIGGAFDTYFPHEACSQFITGQPELDRRPNLGFRCAITLSRLRPCPA